MRIFLNTRAAGSISAVDASLLALPAGRVRLQAIWQRLSRSVREVDPV